MACASRNGAERQASSIGRHAERGEARISGNVEPRREVVHRNGRWPTARSRGQAEQPAEQLRTCGTVSSASGQYKDERQTQSHQSWRLRASESTGSMQEAVGVNFVLGGKGAG